MKAQIQKLRLGDKIRVQVVESVNSSEFIVNFRGDLLRVKNKSLKSLQAGDSIMVRVMELSPLSLQLLPEEGESQPTRIDLFG